MSERASPRQVFNQDDTELLEMLASTAAAALMALEYARLDGVLLAARTAQHELNNQPRMMGLRPPLPPSSRERSG